MRKSLAAPICAVVVLLSGVNGSRAGDVADPITIYLHSVDARSNTPVKSVAVTDKFFSISVEVTRPASPGTHQLSATLFDANGQQVLRTTIEERSQTPKMHLGVGYHLEQGDAVGTWRIVAALDGVPFSEEQFAVTAAHENQ